MEKENKYVGYEYKEVTVKRDLESLCVDGYNSFGWKLEKSHPTIVKHVWGPIRVMIAPLAIIPGSHFSKMVSDHESNTKVDLIFKRNKDIERKVELDRLQLQLQSNIREIEQLEESKSITATIAGYLVGIIGTVFMAGSVFSYLAGMMQLNVVLAAPGFLGWILAYFIYKSVKSSKIKKVTTVIEKQYDNIYDICKKANELI